MELQEGETVIEVGAGHGELTFELAQWPVQILAVEKDRFLIQKLESKIKSQELGGGRVKVVQGDILKILPQLVRKLEIGNWKLAGNIPYYLTGYLFRIIGELKHKPALMVFTLQKEVAERIVAQPPQMNKLAASVQFWAEPEIISSIPRRDFKPIPKIDSVIIKLRIRMAPSALNNYYQVINAVFKQPRKTIVNNLAAGLGMLREKVLEKIAPLGLTGQERGQNLSLAMLKALASIF